MPGQNPEESAKLSQNWHPQQRAGCKLSLEKKHVPAAHGEHKHLLVPHLKEISQFSSTRTHSKVFCYSKGLGAVEISSGLSQAPSTLHNLYSEPS